jgi:hypothetical protein
MDEKLGYQCGNSALAQGHLEVRHFPLLEGGPPTQNGISSSLIGVEAATGSASGVR